MSWAKYKMDYIDHFEECINIFLKYYVQGKLQKILFKCDEESVVFIFVTIDGQEYYIDTYEYKHAKIDRERQRECYFRDESYSDFMEVSEETPLEQIMKEVCQEIRKRFEGVSVDFLLCEEVEV